MFTSILTLSIIQIGKEGSKTATVDDEKNRAPKIIKINGFRRK